MTHYTFSDHALRRMAQRGFKLADIYLALERGQYIYAHETLFVFLGRRQLMTMGNLCERLEGLTLVIDPKTNVILTVYRNRKRLKNIRHKQRRFRRHSLKYKLLN
ncbi:MAG: DUF4258 domain-containing protein [Methanobacteriota archaeon]|nr:MAG: DUF4258 domain-containing protein [Euryarchaeota archaeon]